MPRASKSSVPLALQMVTVQYSGPLSWSSLFFRVLTSGTGTARFLTSAGLVPLSKDQFLLVSSSHGRNQRPLVLAGQSLPSLLQLCTCDGRAHCLDGRRIGRPVGPGKAVHSLLLFRGDKSIFVRLCSRPCRAADSLVTAVDMSLPPAIGPTLGTSFRLSRVLGHPPRLGSASRALGPRRRTETKAIVGDEWYLLLWTRVWPRRLSFTS